jgi:hypothetical protein
MSFFRRFWGREYGSTEPFPIRRTRLVSRPFSSSGTNWPLLPRSRIQMELPSIVIRPDRANSWFPVDRFQPIATLGMRARVASTFHLEVARRGDLVPSRLGLASALVGAVRTSASVILRLAGVPSTGLSVVESLVMRSEAFRDARALPAHPLCSNGLKLSGEQHYA